MSVTLSHLGTPLFASSDNDEDDEGSDGADGNTVDVEEGKKAAAAAAAAAADEEEDEDDDDDDDEAETVGDIVHEETRFSSATWRFKVRIRPNLCVCTPRELLNLNRARMEETSLCFAST